MKNSTAYEYIRDLTSFGNSTNLLILSIFSLQSINLILKVFIGLLIVNTIGYAIKHFFYRDRPEKQVATTFLQRIDAGTFPSLHVARSSLALAFIFANGSLLIKILAVSLVFIVAATRISLKKHYLLDTLGGAILGITIFLFLN